MTSGSQRAALAAALTFACMLMLGPARAQALYPSQTIRFVVPYAAGGFPDTVARVVGKRLQERTGQTIVIENRPGANGGIAASTLATSPADGYTLMVTDGAILSSVPQISSKLAYEPKELAPVTFLAQAPLFLAIHPKVPAATFQEFIDYVKAHPGQINYGSSGVGSVHHISMEGLKSAFQLNMTHIPYKGTGESVPALLGGHVEVLFSAYPSLSGAAGTNRIRLLASNGAKRSAQAPDLPAIAEYIPGFNFASIVGFYARTGTPSAVMQKIAAESDAILKEPEVAKAFSVVGVEPTGGGPDVFRAVIDAEIERVAKVVKAANIRID
jgi:tripartite-type tricarboxylate transporter receptor subunit TctC